MEPLRVTAVMQTGQLASYDGYFTLDGLLSWVWFRENHPEMLEHGAPNNEWPDAELPFEKRIPEHDPRAWYWSVSLGQYEAQREYVFHWHRRFQDERERYIDMSGRRSGRVNTAAGYMKSYRHPVPVLLVPEITWYAVGDADELRRMLPHVQWIGKNRSQGFGWVGEWKVEPWPEDWSERGPGGRIMRDIPTLKEEAEGFSGIRPPYWDRGNHYPVVMWDGPQSARELQAVR